MTLEPILKGNNIEGGNMILILSFFGLSLLLFRSLFFSILSFFIRTKIQKIRDAKNTCSESLPTSDLIISR